MAIQCRCVPTEHKSSQNARTLQVWRRRHCIGVQDQTIWTKVTASTNFTSANHHHLPASYKHEFKKSTKSANNSCEENKRLLPHSSAGFCHPANLMVWSRRFWKFHDGRLFCLNNAWTQSYKCDYTVKNTGDQKTLCWQLLQWCNNE